MMNLPIIVIIGILIYFSCKYILDSGALDLNLPTKECDNCNICKYCKK